MYVVNKRLEISASHQLKLPYGSKCENLHGHNWLIDIQIMSDELTDYGMVLDFVVIKKLIHERLDHANLNEILDINPTAENIATWIRDTITDYLDDEQADRLVFVSKVKVQESEGNIAEWRR